MRTNKERVEEVFKRAENYDSRDRESEKSLRKRTWVKWVSSTLAIVLLIGSVLGLVFTIINRSSNFDLDKMMIANFANYQAIGVGGEDTAAEEVLSNYSTGAQTYASSNSDVISVLLGVKKDSSVEECKVVSKGGGQPISLPSDWRVSGFRAFKNYTFVEFSSINPINRLYDFDHGEQGFSLHRKAATTDIDTVTYILDNRTGMFYSLKNDLPDRTKIGFGFSQTMQTYRQDEYFDIVESDDSLIVNIRIEALGYGESLENTKYNGIYRIYVENENLVLERVLDTSDKSFVINYNDVMIDKFNNIYLTDDVDAFGTNDAAIHPSWKAKYIIDSKGIGKPCNETIYRSSNGICFTSNTTYFDENAEIAECEYQGLFFFNSEYRVKVEDNVEYYYYGDRSGLRNTIYKVAYDPNGINFTVSEISINGTNTAYVTTEEYIYTINGNKLSRFEITTGNGVPFDTPINEKYYFTTIETDNLGNVLFKGLDEVRNKVIGIISNDGEVTVLTKPRDYQVFYIAPVNKRS